MAHPFFHELTQAPPQQNEPTHASHRNSEDDNNTPHRDSEDDDDKENWKEKVANEFVFEKNLFVYIA